MGDLVHKEGMSCPLSKEDLVVLVEEEAKRRLSPEFLAAVKEEERRGDTDGTVTIVKMQEEVVKSFGHPPDMVEVLQSARVWYPGVQEFWEKPVQVRENIMRECRIAIGDVAPNLDIFGLDGAKNKLYKPEDVTVLLAGSYS